MRKKNKFFIIGSSGLIGNEVCKNLEEKNIEYFHSDKNLDITKKYFLKFLTKKKRAILLHPKKSLPLSLINS